MVNPIHSALSVVICNDAADAVRQGYDWRTRTPPVKPAEVKKVVVVRNGTEQGGATADFLIETEDGPYVFLVTTKLLDIIAAVLKS